MLTKYFPAAQSAHTEAPVLAKNVPAPQGIHAAKPVPEMYVPAPQSVHTEAPVLATYFPAAQFAHTEAPVLVTNFPTPHATHAEAPVPEMYPARQSVQNDAPAGLNFPTPHVSHESSDIHHFARNPSPPYLLIKSTNNAPLVATSCWFANSFPCCHTFLVASHRPHHDFSPVHTVKSRVSPRAHSYAIAASYWYMLT